MKSALPVVIIILAACMAAPVTAAVYYSSSTPQIITKGDAFSVSGMGAANGTVALWVIGRNYFEVRSTAPDRHGNFSILFRPTETEKFPSGQYAIVLQDPGADGTMEIEAGRDSGGNLTIMNRGKIFVRFGAKEAPGGNVQEETGALMSAATLPHVDDTFLTAYFFVEEPYVQFDGIIPASGSRLPDQVSGEGVSFTGTTNMGADNPLRAELKNPETNAIITAKAIPVVAGSGLNRWSYGIAAPGLEPGDYLLSVGWTKSNTTGTATALFSVKRPVPAPPVPAPTVTGIIPLPEGLDTLLIVGMLFVFAAVVYATGRK